MFIYKKQNICYSFLIPFFFFFYEARLSTDQTTNKSDALLVHGTTNQVFQLKANSI